MRIAFVSLMGGAQWGGSEVLWHSIALHALRKGDNVFVSIYDWGNLHPKIKQLQEKGAIIYGRKRFNSEARFAEKLVRFIKNRKPSLDNDYSSIIDFNADMVFVSQGDSFDLALHHKALYHLLMAHKIKFSFVCHSHEQFSYIPPPQIFPGAVEVFKNAHKVFFVSNRQWKLTERRLATSLPNGAFTWNPLNMELPVEPLLWPDDTVLQMAMVASLGGNKGHDTAFEVLGKSDWKIRKWKLNIYGKGAGESYLNSLAIYFGIADKVVFHGHIENIGNLWKENHILLVPSAGEGLPISLVEAMACGRPAMVTDIGGMAEVVEDDVSGFIATSPNADSVALAMDKVWQHKDKLKVMGKQAFIKTKKCYKTDPHIIIYNQISNVTAID